MLSVVISTWNEERTLPRVVGSVSDIADEIVVVDTQSTDNTVKIAKKLGCVVYHHRNTGIVEPVRNFSISKAKGDWILLLDADEEITLDLKEVIKKIISDNSYDFVRIPRKNLIFGKWIKSTHWWPDFVYRLFKRGHIEWGDKIHSIPVTRGAGLDIHPDEKNAILHHHYESISQYIKRLDRYTDIQSGELVSSGYKFSWKDLIEKPANEFVRQYFARSGYRDGIHGLALSLLQAFSEVVLYLKLWQEDGFKNQTIETDQLHAQIRTASTEYEWWFYQSKIDSSAGIGKLINKFKRITKI